MYALGRVLLWLRWRLAVRRECHDMRRVLDDDLTLALWACDHRRSHSGSCGECEEIRGLYRGRNEQEDV